MVGRASRTRSLAGLQLQCPTGLHSPAMVDGVGRSPTTIVNSAALPHPPSGAHPGALQWSAGRCLRSGCPVFSRRRTVPCQKDPGASQDDEKPRHPNSIPATSRWSASGSPSLLRMLRCCTSVNRKPLPPTCPVRPCTRRRGWDGGPGQGPRRPAATRDRQNGAKRP